jgi:hypothetical protein
VIAPVQGGMKRLKIKFLKIDPFSGAF